MACTAVRKGTSTRPGGGPDVPQVCASSLSHTDRSSLPDADRVRSWGRPLPEGDAVTRLVHRAVDGGRQGGDARSPELPTGPVLLSEFEHLLSDPGCPACTSLAEAERSYFAWFGSENHTSPAVQSQLTSRNGDVPGPLSPAGPRARRRFCQHHRPARSARRGAPAHARRRPAWALPGVRLGCARRAHRETAGSAGARPADAGAAREETTAVSRGRPAACPTLARPTGRAPAPASDRPSALPTAAGAPQRSATTTDPLPGGSAPDRRARQRRAGCGPAQPPDRSAPSRRCITVAVAVAVAPSINRV